MTKSAETTTAPPSPDATVTAPADGAEITPSDTTRTSSDAGPSPSRLRRDRSKTPARPRRMASVKQLLLELERLQHRAVMLDQLAHEVGALFGTELHDQPKYLIGVEGGTAIPARLDVLLVLEMELHRAADLARAQIRRRLEMRMTAPAEEPIAPITEGVPPPVYVAVEEGDEELSSTQPEAVPNPTAARLR